MMTHLIAPIVQFNGREKQDSNTIVFSPTLGYSAHNDNEERGMPMPSQSSAIAITDSNVQNVISVVAMDEKFENLLKRNHSSRLL